MEEKLLTIDWTETSDENKVNAILEYVLGAKWNNNTGWWHIGDIATRYRSFDPIHDMNHAMLIVQHLNTYVHFGFSPAASRYEPHVDHFYCEITVSDWPEHRSVQAYAKTLSEAVCVAALRKEGIQVVNAFEALTAYELTDEKGETHLFKTGKLALDEYNHRAERLKENLQWAKNIRKMKIQERQVPEDFWNGIEMA